MRFVHKPFGQCVGGDGENPDALLPCFFGRVRKLFVDLRDHAVKRRIDLRDRFDGFQLAARLSRRNGGADFGQFDLDDFPEFLRRVRTYADVRFSVAQLRPFVCACVKFHNLLLYARGGFSAAIAITVFSSQKATA